MDSWIDHLVKNGFDYVPDVEKAEYPNVKLKITWHGGINLIPFIKPE
jgi:hypothetical protein